MNVISYLRAFLAIFISRFADNSVENVVAGISKLADKLETVAAHHADKIDKAEAAIAAAAAQKIASEAEIAKAKAVVDNFNKLLSR